MRKVAAAIALVIFLLVVLTIGLTGFAHGAVSKKHDNSLGVVQYQNNPFTYLEGAVVNIALVGDGVNIRMQPRGTYSLFTQELLLCHKDHVFSLFQGKQNPIVLTYERVAHETIEGLGCHELRSIDEVTSEKQH